MAAISIQVPYPVFYDRDGQPLDNGNIYIGVANLDPVTNPIQVYYDDALTIPASQPLKTSNGYIYRNGTPAQLYVNAINFSILVNDAKNTLVYSFPDGTGLGVGAAGVDYNPPFIGALTSGYTVEDKLSQTVSVKDFGAVGDGVTDDTAAIQAAITATRLQGGESRKLYWTSGTYLITDTLTLGTNQCIEFDPGVTVNFVAADPLNTSLFVAANQSEVTLWGNGAVLNGTRGTVAGQGTGTAFFMYGSDNIVIRDFVINDFATDGITLTGDDIGSGPCFNVIIEQCQVNNCRRNGMSIISAINCTVIGGSYSGTNGALGGPWAGIDIEPNADCFLENVNLVGVGTGNNDGPGIQFTPGALSATISKRYNVFVTGGRSINDGALFGIPALYFANGGPLTNKMFGEIVINGFTVEAPKSRGVSFNEWEADKTPRVIMDSITVYDPDGTSVAATNVNRSGFVLYLDSGQTSTTLGNIVMRNCLAEDTRSPARMVWGTVVSADAGKQIKDVTIIDPKSINFDAANKADVNTAVASTLGSSDGFDVSYTNPSLADIGGSQSIADFGGKRINATSSGIALTLPAAANCSGLAYEIQTAPTVNSVSVAVQAGDTILGTVGVASTNLVLDAGGFIRLRSRGGTSWAVEELDGLWRIPGMSTPRKIQFHNAAPVSGTWARGDIVFNADAATGQPKGWQCTVAGTPGTWVSMGNL